MKAYLVEQARKTPAAFLTLVGKILPLQVEGKDGEPPIPVLNVTVAQAKDDG